MKKITLPVSAVLIGLSVLWLAAPAVRADEDYVTEINRYIDQIYQDQKAREDYMQSIQDGIDQVIKQRDQLLDRGTDAQPAAWPVAPVPQVPAIPQPQVLVVSAPQMKFPPVPKTAWVTVSQTVQTFPAQHQQVITGVLPPALAK